MHSQVIRARLAQMVERMTLNHVVAGSIPAVGAIFALYIYCTVYNCYASIVQWLEFVPSKHEVRVRFPVDAHKKSEKNDSFIWSCGVMASTVDSESTDPGSNPGRTKYFELLWRNG